MGNPCANMNISKGVSDVWVVSKDEMLGAMQKSIVFSIDVKYLASLPRERRES